VGLRLPGVPLLGGAGASAVAAHRRHHDDCGV